MAYAPIPNQGIRLYISSTPTGLATLEVLGVENIDRYGLTHTEIDVTTLGDTFKRRLKGLKDGGAIAFTGNRNTTDPGQQKMIEARAALVPYNFKIELNDAVTSVKSKIEGSGFVMMFDTQPGSPDGVVKFSGSIGVDGATTETVAS